MKKQSTVAKTKKPKEFETATPTKPVIGHKARFFESSRKTVTRK